MSVFVSSRGFIHHCTSKCARTRSLVPRVDDEMTEKADASSHITIEEATVADLPAICAMVIDAYTKYIDRIGRKPAPMTADYEQLLQTHEIYVLRDALINDNKVCAGSIVVKAEGNALHINNLVVSPNAQGRGYGRVLMDFAETLARKRALKKLELYTNVKMWENIGLYAKLGFTETERRIEDGFERVYFEKNV